MKTVLAATVLLSALALSACSPAPSEKAAEVAPAASQAPAVTSTPSATPKPVEAPVAVAVARTPEEQKAIDTINGLKDCSMVTFYVKTFTAIAAKTDIPASSQQTAKEYVALADKKGTELGCPK